MSKTKLEYIWLDGYFFETQQVAAKPVDHPYSYVFEPPSFLP